MSKFNITITNDKKPFMTINCDDITITQDADGIYIHIPFDKPIVAKIPFDKPIVAKKQTRKFSL